MRNFYIINRRASEPNTPYSGLNGTSSIKSANGATNANQLQRRERLRYRDMIWAFHSESQDLLLSSSVAACGGKMCWVDARALGVFTWMQSTEAMVSNICLSAPSQANQSLQKAHMEVIARNQYMAGDNRDPTACSLFYFALGKVKLVHGLWSGRKTLGGGRRIS